LTGQSFVIFPLEPRGSVSVGNEHDATIIDAVTLLVESEVQKKKK
jgi:hypothetical protein